MARPKKVRIISNMPKCLKFKADYANKSVTTLTFEEYEAIRLMDYARLTHDEAATMMNVSRTTMTEIYDVARKKVAKALCEGTSLEIKGGNYAILDEKEKRSRFNSLKKGNNMKLKIAVTYDNGQVYQHFGHTEAFKIYEIEGKEILSEEVVSTNGQGHGQLAVFLLNQHVHLLICGGIGGGAVTALSQAGIKLLPGVTGGCDEAVKAYLNDTLVYNPNVKCEHHEHEHKGCNCGDAHHDCDDHHEHGHGCHCEDK